MKEKVHSYLRVSSESQITGDGFPRQRESINRFIKRNRMELVTEFRDEGVSGVMFDRPGLTDLFVSLKSNGVKKVVIENSSRLSRDLIVGETLLNEFKKIGVTVVTSDGTILTDTNDDDPSKKMIRQILGVFSEFEKSCLVQKLRVSRIRMKKSKGVCEGRKPFGSRPGETDIINKIKLLRHEGNSVKGIVEILKNQGIVSRYGKFLKYTQIRRILDRP